MPPSPKSAMLVCKRYKTATDRQNDPRRSVSFLTILHMIVAANPCSQTPKQHILLSFRRLAQAGQLFHTALTVPLYFTSPATSTNRTNVNMNGLWERKQLMGVVVVYFRAPREATSASALVSYAAAVAKSAAPMSELMVQRARFVVGRSHRIKRKWRVLVIALRFAMPILVK